VAFSTTVVDNFNRADGPLTGTFWSFPAWPAYNQPAIASDQLSGVTFPSAYWTQSITDPYQVGMKMVADGSNTSVLFLIQSGVGTSINGYFMTLTVGPDVYVGICTAGSTTQETSSTAAAGPYYGLEVTGGLISAYQSADGVTWSFVVSWADSTYTGPFTPGFLGNGAPTFDDFSINTLAATSTSEALLCENSIFLQTETGSILNTG
jgi:hypothetical protein